MDGDAIALGPRDHAKNELIGDLRGYVAIGFSNERLRWPVEAKGGSEGAAPSVRTSTSARSYKPDRMTPHRTWRKNQRFVDTRAGFYTVRGRWGRGPGERRRKTSGTSRDT